MTEPTPRRRLRGHALRGEGAPYSPYGKRIAIGSYAATGGYGHGLCECGSISPELPSSTARKAWHREHKTALRAVLAAGGGA